MNGGFGMKKDLMRVSNPQECFICTRIFSTPRDLILHHHAFHPNHHFPTFSSPTATAAPTTLGQYPNLNRNPNPFFPTRNRFDLNDYRSGYMDEQGRFHPGSPATTPTPARTSNFVSGQQEKPKLTMSSEGPRTLPLICQLEQRRWQDSVTEKGETIATSIDLTLRLWH